MSQATSVPNRPIGSTDPAMPDFLLPDLGEGLTEAEIIAWRVQVGDRVEIDQIVVEVETAKAAVEVPVPFAGTVAHVHAEPGQSVAVGTALISVHADDEASGNVLIGYGTSEARPRRRRPRLSRPAQGLPAPVPVPPEPILQPARALAVVSPLVRKLARDSRLDLAVVTGTGPAGLITRRDVEQAVAAPAATKAPVDRPAVAAATDLSSDERRIPLTGIRKVIADKMSRSRREIPEATVWVDVDATPLLAVRAELNQRNPDRPVSVLALVARFTVSALRLYPELNARIEGNEIVLSGAVHLGFAAQTDRGLVVPVIHDAHRLSTRELAGAIAAHTASARAGSLTPAEVTGGTFTVNNYGVFGVDGSAAIINHPEVGILGIGRIVDKPWVHDGVLAVRKVTQLTLAFDHRVCDGATAGGFLRYVADCVESPAVALGDL